MLRTFEFNGCKMFLDDSQTVHQYFLGNGLNYEPHIRKELVRLIPKATVMWDIGANLGIHTISAKQLNPQLRVFCFEPAALNQQLLAKTIALNGWKDVCLIPVAIGDYDGLTSMNNDPANPCCGKHGDACPNWQPILRLDSFDLPLPQVVKIDIEGFELHALRAASKLLSARPVILSELNLVCLADNGGAEAYVDFLLSHQYRVTVLDYKPGQRHQVSNGQEAVDYVRQTSGEITDIIAEPL